MARARRGLSAAIAGARAPVCAGAAAALWMLVAASQPASALRALHVDALSMRTDRAVVQVGQVFHLAIHVHVREAVARLDELVVPDVGTMQLLGDERNVATSASGSDVVETLTLEPTQAGTFTFAGAYLDAIDARTKKPSRFSANGVRVVVEKPGGALLGESFWSAVRLAAVVAVLGVVLVAVVVAFAVVARASRRRRPAVDVAPPLAAAPVAAAPRTPRDAVADALRTYRVTPASGPLLRLRAALFAAAGVNEGATLRDALAATPDAALREALIAAEHTAFGPAHARDASSETLIRTTEGWLR